MQTIVYLPYAWISVEDRRLEASLDRENEEIYKISSLQYQLRQECPGTGPHGLCIMTTYAPSIMWLTGYGLFYRLLFTINVPVEGRRDGRELARYEVKVYPDRLSVLSGWQADKPFPILATVHYNIKEFDARPLFLMT